MIKSYCLLSQRVDSEDALMTYVFPDMPEKYRDSTWLSEMAILTPKNYAVNVTPSIPKVCTCYLDKEELYIHGHSARSRTSHLLPIVFLNSLQPAGVPLRINLLLKVGTPILLLRKIDPPSLSNGTRLTIKQILPHVLEATIMKGKANGENVRLHPRIPIVQTDCPIELKIPQCLVRPIFAMTTKKSQGQTLKAVGLDQKEAVFSHDQIYMAVAQESAIQTTRSSCPTTDKQ